MLAAAITIWAIVGAGADGFDDPFVAVALGLALVGANLAPVVAVSGGRIDAFTPVGALLVPIGLLLPLPEAVVVYAVGEGLGVVAAHRWDRHIGGPESEAVPRTTFVIGKSIVGAVVGLLALQQVADAGSPVPDQLLAAFVGVAVSTLFDRTAVAVLASLVDHGSFREEFSRGLGQLTTVAGGEVVAGALIAVLAGRDPWSLLLGLAMLALLAVAGSAYARAAADRSDTRELLRLAGELQEARTPEEVHLALLGSARRLLPEDEVQIADRPPTPDQRGWRLGEDDPRWLTTPRVVGARDYEQQPMAVVEAAVALAGVALTRTRAQELLVEQDRLRALILSTVAHDLRSPLAVASGGLELLTEGDPRLGVDQRAQLLSASARAVERIRRLIDDLLGLERSAGRGEGSARVPDVVGDVVAELDTQGVDLHLDLTDTTAAIDPVSLGRIVENLLSNAVKYSPPGGRVRISCSSAADDGVSLVVADQGPGVPPEDRQGIFEPFSNQERRGDGVGLGLYVTRRFAETNGGSVWVDDAPEGGAAFHVWLPAVGS